MCSPSDVAGAAAAYWRVASAEDLSITLTPSVHASARTSVRRAAAIGAASLFASRGLVGGPTWTCTDVDRAAELLGP